MTMRLIDADALIGHLKEVAGCDTCDRYIDSRCKAPIRYCPWDVPIMEVDDWADNHPIQLVCNEEYI